MVKKIKYKKKAVFTLNLIQKLKYINDKDYVNNEIECFSNYVSDNTLYLVFHDVDIYFLCVDEEKYLVFALTDKNKEVLENYKKL